MKVTINIECTPIEAREFFGLPDMSQINADIMAQMRENIAKGMDKDQMEQVMKSWITGAQSGFSEWQKMLWQSFGTQQDKS